MKDLYLQMNCNSILANYCADKPDGSHHQSDICDMTVTCKNGSESGNGWCHQDGWYRKTEKDKEDKCVRYDRLAGPFPNTCQRKFVFYLQ